MGSVTEGDRIWWTWHPDEMPEDFRLSKIFEDELGKRTETPTRGCCMQDNEFTKVTRNAGVYCTIMEKCGVETYRSSFTEHNENTRWCCLISQPKAKVSFFSKTFFTLSNSKVLKKLYKNFLFDNQ